MIVVNTEVISGLIDIGVITILDPIICSPLPVLLLVVRLLPLVLVFGATLTVHILRYN